MMPQCKFSVGDVVTADDRFGQVVAITHRDMVRVELLRPSSMLFQWRVRGVNYLAEEAKSTYMPVKLYPCSKVTPFLRSSSLFHGVAQARTDYIDEDVAVRLWPQKGAQYEKVTSVQQLRPMGPYSRTDHYMRGVVEGEDGFYIAQADVFMPVTDLVFSLGDLVIHKWSRRYGRVMKINEQGCMEVRHVDDDGIFTTKKMGDFCRLKENALGDFSFIDAELPVTAELFWMQSVSNLELW